MRILIVLLIVLTLNTGSFAQCSLTENDDTQSEVLSCLSACGCNHVIIPDGVFINMTGDWNLTSAGDIIFEIKGTGSLIFDGNGSSAESLILASGSTLLIEDQTSTTALVADGGNGQVRVVIGTKEFKESNFTEIISSGGADESGALPIELISFRYNILNNNYIELNWATQTEENFDYFEVQTSVDAIEYTTIGKVKGSGWSQEIRNYEFVDYNPGYGVNYYRLKAVDFDGYTEYFGPISIYREEAYAPQIIITENPVKQHLLKLIYRTSSENPEQISIIGKSGNHVLTQTITPGLNLLQLPEDLKKGLYLIRLSKTDSFNTVKFIVE